METNKEACLIEPLPRRRKAVAVVEERYESRPRRRGEVSEARRLDEGFRMLNGEGVYADNGD